MEFNYNTQDLLTFSKRKLIYLFLLDKELASKLISLVNSYYSSYSYKLEDGEEEYILLGTKCLRITKQDLIGLFNESTHRDKKYFSVSNDS